MYARDAEELFALLKAPELYLFIGASPPASAQWLAQRITNWESRRSPDRKEVWLNWTLRRKADRIAIGYTQATIPAAAVATNAELAWVIGLPFQRQGYAKEAAGRVADWLTDRFDVSELRAHIHPTHVASQRVAASIGLHRRSTFSEDCEELWVERVAGISSSS